MTVSLQTIAWGIFAAGFFVGGCVAVACYACRVFAQALNETEIAE